MHRNAKSMTALAVAAAIATISASAAAFTIKDIRIDGISRTEPGTVLSHLPFRVGDDFNEQQGNEAIHALYRSGLFRDVQIGSEGNVVVVTVQERPAVASIDTQGIRLLDKDSIGKSLNNAGLAEGRVFNPATLERAVQELRRQYLTQGYYAVDVKSTVTPIERNRVRLVITVEEGQAAGIKSIRFIGNNVFDDGDLLDEMELRTKSKWKFLSSAHLYSREKLAADVEAIRTFYLDRGYLDFKIDSVQVSIAPNKEDVFITINMTEGEQYRIGEVKLEGDLLGLETDLTSLIGIKTGDIYNEANVNKTSEAIVNKLSSLGYAFASVTPNPTHSPTGNVADIIYTVDPGRRAYVRKVIISGNTRTKDEVIRREIRQYEAAWYDSEKVKLSRDRVDRLGYFNKVAIDPVPVPGTRDQVDLMVEVEDRPTGSVNLGIGYSTSDGIILSASLSQDNIFGTGNSFAMTFDNSKSSRTYDISYTTPYITPEGISQTVDAYVRRTDLNKLDLSDVAYETRGVSLNYGIPVTEFDRVYVGGKWESTKVTLRAKSPQRYVNFVKQFGKNPQAVAATVGWSRDSRDNGLAPTRGLYQRFNAEVSVPGLDLKYYRLNYEIQHYLPLSKHWTFASRAQVGYGDGYGGKPYPFFKNFYAGGIGTVRGYESSSLGPKDTDGESSGGNSTINFSFELLAPIPGADRTLRTFAFFDGGYVWGDRYDGAKRIEKGKISLSDLRYSTGIGLAWVSPIGPLKFSYAFPIKDKKGDKTERFQFQIGTGF